MTFADYALAQLPRPPLRVLEVGCGREGGLVPTLADAGYDVLGIDPEAPVGPRYRRIELAQLEDAGSFGGVVASRVLHHVHPLDAALDRLVALAPLLVLDEFAWNHIDERTRVWYDGRRRELDAAGLEPKGPDDLDEWRWAHPGLHPYETLRRELDARYRERHSEWRPYLYRWLGDPETERLERAAIAAATISPIGFRYVGVALG